MLNFDLSDIDFSSDEKIDESLNQNKAKEFKDPIIKNIYNDVQDYISTLPWIMEKNLVNIPLTIKYLTEMKENIYVGIYHVPDFSALFNLVHRLNIDLGPELNLNWIDISEIVTFTDFISYKAKIDCRPSRNLLWLFYDIQDFCGDISLWNTSNVKSMDSLFYGSKFNGDISKWDTSNVMSMYAMFYKSDFDGDISQWNTGKCQDMSYMFARSKFNSDISHWDVSSVKNMNFMFLSSIFNQDISHWNTMNVEQTVEMFSSSYFNQDLSQWDVSKVNCNKFMFDHCGILEKYKPRFKNSLLTNYN